MTARAKGAAGERELAVLLHQRFQDILDRVPQRNLEQTRSGGHDLTGVPWLAVECKRVERLQVAKWWQQAVRQAGECCGVLPVLAYRQNRKQWTFVVPDTDQWDVVEGRLTFYVEGVLENPVEMDWGEFDVWYRGVHEYCGENAIPF